jgi:hypothetical protein
MFAEDEQKGGGEKGQLRGFRHGDGREVRSEIAAEIRGKKLIEALPDTIDLILQDLKIQRHKILEESKKVFEYRLDKAILDKQIQHVFGTAMNNINHGLEATSWKQQLPDEKLRAMKTQYFENSVLTLDEAKDLVRMLIRKIIEEFKGIYPGQTDTDFEGLGVIALLEQEWFASEPIRIMFGDWNPFFQQKR